MSVLTNTAACRYTTLHDLTGKNSDEKDYQTMFAEHPACGSADRQPHFTCIAGIVNAC